MADYHMGWAEVYTRLNVLIKPGKKYWGIPRGGQYVAGATGQAVTDIGDADYIIDDIYDSGATAKKYDHYNKPFVFLVDKRKADDAEMGWVRFPWEQESVQDFEDDIRRIIQRIDSDPNREGLRDTPGRVAKALTELTTPEPFTPTTFDANGYDQMIVESRIPFYSLCEHHMLPFFGDAYIGYIPDKKIIGVSKLIRSVSFYSHGLHTQEYMTGNIANYLEEVLRPIGIGVILTARHLCQEMRGVKSRGEMSTSALLGKFRNPEVREEFLNLCKKNW